MLSSNDLDVTVLISAVISLLLGYLLLKNFFNSLPPGPWGLPFFGCWPWMTHDWHKDFMKLGKGCGDIFTVYILNSPVVVLNGTKSIQEAFYKKPNAWAGRPYSHGFDLHQIDRENLFKDDFTAEFKARKKFALTNLKKFGYGLQSIQENIQGEIDHTVAAFKSHKSEPFFLQKAMWIHGANPIPSILLDRTFEPNDKEFQHILEDTDVWFTTMKPTCEADTVPFLRFFPRKCVKDGRQATKRLVAWFTRAIEERRTKFDPNNPCCFVDICIQNQHCNKEILRYIMSFWGDGTDTIIGTIRWWIYFMAHHQGCQANAQQEIDCVLEGRPPMQSDKKDLPYLEATFMEAVRVATPVPLSLPLKTTEDIEILGHTIPKDTNCFANWYMMHKDPELFENPDEFNPDRFILEDGTCDTKNKGWVGFAIGKRNCIGEPLARQVTFLFLANFLQHFTFSYPEDEVPSRSSEDVGISGIVVVPRDFKIIATPRKTSEPMARGKEKEPNPDNSSENQA